MEVLSQLDEVIEPAAGIDERFRARLRVHRDQASNRRAAPVRNWVAQWRLPSRIAAAGALAAVIVAGIYVSMQRGGPPEPVPTEVAIAESLPMLQDLGVIRNLDLLEDFELIEELPQNAPAPH